MKYDQLPSKRVVLIEIRHSYSAPSTTSPKLTSVNGAHLIKYIKHHKDKTKMVFKEFQDPYTCLTTCSSLVMSGRWLPVARQNCPTSSIILPFPSEGWDMGLNVTFNSIPVMSWRSVLLVEDFPNDNQNISLDRGPF